jgi:hypothetical protein
VVKNRIKMKEAEIFFPFPIFRQFRFFEYCISKTLFESNVMLKPIIYVIMGNKKYIQKIVWFYLCLGILKVYLMIYEY